MRTIGHSRKWLREEIRLDRFADDLARWNAAKRAEDAAGIRYVDGVLRDRNGRFAALGGVA